MSPSINQSGNMTFGHLQSSDTKLYEKLKPALQQLKAAAAQEGHEVVVIGQNNQAEKIALEDFLANPQLEKFQNAQSAALTLDIHGHTLVLDLQKLDHDSLLQSIEQAVAHLKNEPLALEKAHAFQALAMPLMESIKQSALQHQQTAPTDATACEKTAQSIKKIVKGIKDIEPRQMGRLVNLLEDAVSTAKNAEDVVKLATKDPNLKSFIGELFPGKPLDIAAFALTFWKNISEVPGEPTSGLDKGQPTHAALRALFQTMSINLIEEAYKMYQSQGKHTKGFGTDLAVNALAAILSETAKHTATKADDIAAQALSLTAEGTPSKLAEGAFSLYYDLLIKGSTGDDVANKALEGKYGIAFQGSAIIAESFTEEGRKRIVDIAEKQVQQGTQYGKAIELSSFSSGVYLAAKEGDWERVYQLADEEVKKGSNIGAGIVFAENTFGNIIDATGGNWTRLYIRSQKEIDESSLVGLGIQATDIVGKYYFKAQDESLDLADKGAQNVRDLATGNTSSIVDRAQMEINLGTKTGDAIEYAEGMTYAATGNYDKVNEMVKKQTSYGQGVSVFEHGFKFWFEKFW